MKILGVKIDNLSLEEALEKAEEFLEDKKQHYIVTPNPEFLVQAWQDEQFRQILNQADLAVPDGVGLVLASWFLDRPLKGRVAGTDLMEKICQRAARGKWPVFLVGGAPVVAREAAENLRRKYPGLEIFEGTPQKELGRPAVLFVALGAGKQERWIADNLPKMPGVGLAMGVGGAFDFMAGRVRRAPLFLRKAGLEWLWRLLCQPWRYQRIFRAVLKFPYLVIKNKQQGND